MPLPRIFFFGGFRPGTAGCFLRLRRRRPNAGDQRPPCQRGIPPIGKSKCCCPGPDKFPLAFLCAACYNALQCCVEPPGMPGCGSALLRRKASRGALHRYRQTHSFSSGIWGACVLRLSGVAGPGQSGAGAASVSMRSFCLGDTGAVCRTYAKTIALRGE